MVTVTIYSTPTCPFCHQVKDFFAAHNVSFTDYNVAEDEVRRDEMVEKSGQMGVPVIEIDGEIVAGFDKQRLETLLKSPNI